MIPWDDDRETAAGPTSDDELALRYGAPRPWLRVITIAGVVLLALTFLGWLAWAATDHATPQAESKLIAYEVVDAHRSEATIEVRVADGVTASCRVRAYSEDHAVVGEQNVDVDGVGSAQQVEIGVRTEREATSVELIGCTAPGQKRPQ